MKIRIILLSTVLLFSVASVVYAADSIKAILFPVTYKFNGATKELEKGYVTLNYENRAYVPVRFVAETLGARVSYDHTNKSISFNNSNLFDAATIQTGEVIANMKVVNFDLQSVDNLYMGTVQFSGSALITGTLTYSIDEMFGELLLFTPDSTSVTKLPQMSHDTRTTSLTFTNVEEAKKLMGIQAGTEHASETVAVEIDEFLINYQEKEILNTAKLNKVYFQSKK